MIVLHINSERERKDKGDLPRINQPQCVLPDHASPTKGMLPQVLQRLYLRQSNF